MNTIQHLRKLGQSLWLDSISRPMLDDGRIATLRQSQLEVTGLTSNPTIFDEAIGTRRLRPGDRAKDQRRQVGRGSVLSSWRSTTCAAPPRCSGRLTMRTARGRWLGIHGALAAARGRTPRAACSAAARIHRAAHLPNLFVKIPGTPEGRARHRAVDLRRRADQCDAAVFGEHISPRRSLSAWHRAPHRRRSFRGRLGRFAVRQPLGQGGRGQGRPPLAQPARNCDRRSAPTGIPRFVGPRAGRSSPAPARARSACCGPARDQGSQCSGVVVRGSIRRAGHHRHVAGEDSVGIVATRSSAASHAHGWRRLAARPGGVPARWNRHDDALARCGCSARAREAFVKSWHSLMERIADKGRALGMARKSG